MVSLCVLIFKLIKLQTSNMHSFSYINKNKTKQNPHKWVKYALQNICLEFWPEPKSSELVNEYTYGHWLLMVWLDFFLTLWMCKSDTRLVEIVLAISWASDRWYDTLLNWQWPQDGFVQLLSNCRLISILITPKVD